MTPQYRTIKASDLKRVLSEVPDGYDVMANAAGNLSLLCNDVFVGYVVFDAAGECILFPDEDTCDEPTSN
jgi:hypothetical protein